MKLAHPRYTLEFLYTSFPELDKVEWYKWEFLRRNPEYRADYKKFAEAHGKWLSKKGYWYDLDKRPNWEPSDEKYFYQKIAPEIVHLCQKWQIGDLHPPHWRFKKKRNWEVFKAERPSGPATGFPLETNWNHRLIVDLMEMGFTGTGRNARRYGHLVLVEFDLKWPIKDLSDFAKRVLIRAQSNYKAELEEQGFHFPIGRRRFDEYSTHLRVWDLRKGQHKKLAEIAEIVFPNQSKELGLRMVRDHLKAAEKLVMGRYKEIR